MGRIIRHFQCRNKSCKKKPKWANSKYQAEEQECDHCKQITKAYKSENQGRLFGEFNCKICGSKWFSGNSYEDQWHQCSKCSVKCYPKNLREHDKKESKDDSDEEKKDEKKKKSKKKHYCQKCKELGYNCQDDVDILMRKNKPLSSLLGDVFLPQAPKIAIFEDLDDKPLFPIEDKKKELTAKESQKKPTDKQKKKTKNKKEAPAKSKSAQEKDSEKDADFWDSDNEHDQENWFYTADDVYPDAPFRLEDYKKKLASGSVKEPPMCNPYRKLYFCHLNTIKQKEENKARREKEKKAHQKVENEGDEVGQDKITHLFICSTIQCAAHGNTAWQNNEPKKEIENCPTCGFKTKAFRTVKSKDAKIESDKPISSSSAPREKPKVKKFTKRQLWWALKKRKTSNSNKNDQKSEKNQNDTLQKKIDALTV